MIIGYSCHILGSSLFQSPDMSEESKHRLKNQIASSLSRSKFSFCGRMDDITQQGKIHAEIQLLFFYEPHPEGLQPRIICSSKSACYLCNLFIQIHGQFFMPRTHGRLYDKWILPDWLESVPSDRHQKLGIVVNKLNIAIENKIRTVFTGMQKPYLHPNESVLVGPAHWPSTSDLSKQSTVSSRSTATLRQATISDQEDGSSGDQTASATTPDNSSERACNRLTQPVSQSEARTNTCSNMRSPSVAYETSSQTSSTNSIPAVPLPRDSRVRSPAPYKQLIRGKCLWKQLLDTGKPLQISTKSIHATVSSTAGSSDDGDVSINNRWVQLKWLQPEEWQAMQCGSSTVVHLRDLEEGVDIVLAKVQTLYLCHAQDVVSITCSPQGPS
jgi:hypothetical protein